MNFIKLMASKVARFSQRNRRQPEFRIPAVTLNMDMNRFPSIKAEKEEPVTI
jgi:hypothetical protein